MYENPEEPPRAPALRCRRPCLNLNSKIGCTINQNKSYCDEKVIANVTKVHELEQRQKQTSLFPNKYFLSEITVAEVKHIVSFKELR